MSIKKKFLKSKPVCKTTFRVDKEVALDAAQVAVVGEFNDWDSAVHPMKGLKSGDFTLTIDLEQGKAYQFRYLIDGKRWVNDEEADKFVVSPYGDSRNCVLEL